MEDVLIEMSPIYSFTLFFNSIEAIFNYNINNSYTTNQLLKKDFKTETADESRLQNIAGEEKIT